MSGEASLAICVSWIMEVLWPNQRAVGGSAAGWPQCVKLAWSTVAVTMRMLSTVLGLIPQSWPRDYDTV